jgi:alpha-ketoglutaric semialdehyde dehydrogenase
LQGVFIVAQCASIIAEVVYRSAKRRSLSMPGVEISLSGLSLVGDGAVVPGTTTFHGVNPATGQEMEPAFYAATGKQIDEAVTLATAAFFPYSSRPAKERAAFLRSIADGLAGQKAAIVERANLETGLPLARLEGELAAGCPVVVKAHPAHPGTSELVGRAIQNAVKESGLPAGVFSLLFDAGVEVGVALVKHPGIKAVGFTGSQNGGKALMRLAAEREEPIPCYAEMGSTNPLFILPGAMKERGEALAKGLQGSFTLGSGQFCTKPGLVFGPASEMAIFGQQLREGVDALGNQGMLTPGIAAKYSGAVEERTKHAEAKLVAGEGKAADKQAAAVPATVFEVALKDFLASKALEEEIFGPTTLLIEYGEKDDLVAAAERLHGHLTATIHGTEEDLAGAEELIRVLETKVGRVLFNGYPTGVEVCHAMVHGGPYPATSDSRTTSVGTKAIERFVRPVCYQDFPDALLPVELRRGNSLGIMRLVNGTLTRS